MCYQVGPNCPDCDRHDYSPYDNWSTVLWERCEDTSLPAGSYNPNTGPDVHAHDPLWRWTCRDEFKTWMIFPGVSVRSCDGCISAEEEFKRWDQDGDEEEQLQKKKDLAETRRIYWAGNKEKYNKTRAERKRLAQEQTYIALAKRAEAEAQKSKPNAKTPAKQGQPSVTKQTAKGKEPGNRKVGNASLAPKADRTKANAVIKSTQKAVGQGKKPDISKKEDNLSKAQVQTSARTAAMEQKAKATLLCRGIPLPPKSDTTPLLGKGKETQSSKNKVTTSSTVKAVKSFPAKSTFSTSSLAPLRGRGLSSASTKTTPRSSGRSSSSTARITSSNSTDLSSPSKTPSPAGRATPSKKPPSARSQAPKVERKEPRKLEIRTGLVKSASSK